MPDLTALDFLILAMATWRVSHMLVYENGPRKMFVHIRDITRNWTWIDFACAKCIGVWVAAFMLIALLTWAWPLVWVFAASGMALMLASYSGVDYNAQQGADE